MPAETERSVGLTCRKTVLSPGTRSGVGGFDPRNRPWYDAAKRGDIVKQSDLYLFASNGEPGFTLSRRFKAPVAGVLGADLAETDLALFLREQKDHAGLHRVHLHHYRRGHRAARSSPYRPCDPGRRGDEALPPKISDPHDSVIAALAAAYRSSKMSGTRVYDAADRTFIGRVIEIPPPYGRNQLLAIMVPIDEIEKPINDIRNQTLLYSIAFLSLPCRCT